MTTLAADSPAAPQRRCYPAMTFPIHRRYFLAGIAAMLTVGVGWGALLLWKIGFAESFTGVTIHEVNAHGHAQIFGWVGLFIMGFAYQMFPGLWGTPRPAPKLAALNLVLMLAGIAIRSAGMTTAGAWDHALTAAMIGGALELIAIAIFAAQMLVVFIRSTRPTEPWMGFVYAAMAFFVIQAVWSVVHTYATMSAPTTEALLAIVATYQAPLRDVQIHGMAMLMILGVSLKMLPGMFSLPLVPRRRSWWALGILVAAVVLETALFLLYRYTGMHAMAGLLMLPWLMLPMGAAIIAWPWKLWRPMPLVNRSNKFIRAAYAWLAISLLMLLLLPVYQLASGIPFSHAYYGAARHAITVGFVSIMIMGVAAWLVPTLARADFAKLPSLWGPFVLINVGCFLRVSLQTLTDWHDGAFAVVGISALLELAALAWWGGDIARIILRHRRQQKTPSLAPTLAPALAGETATA